jgi:glyoxylase-like metal-dependent hydrolase (beta-lactamase superfamily II)
VTANVNTAGLPYLVVCSHVHFDHVGGNHRFASAGAKSGGDADGPGCLGIWMGGRKPAFTENYPLTSCCASHG